MLLQTAEVHRALDYLKSQNYQGLAIGILSKRDLCILEGTRKENESYTYSDCHDRCSQGECEYFHGPPLTLPQGAYTLEDIKSASLELKSCAYYSSRSLIESSSLLVTTIGYFLTHKSDFLYPDKTLVFENCDKLDEFISDSLSIHLNNKILTQVLRNIRTLNTSSESLNTSFSFIKPVAPPANLPIPGSLRKSQHFLSIAKLICVFLRKQLRTKEPSVCSAAGLLFQMAKHAHLSVDQLQWLSMRCWHLLSAQRSIQKHRGLQIVCNFVSLISLRPQGFSIVVEPYTEGQKYSPVLQLSCFDVRFYMQDLVSTYKKLIISIRGRCTPVFQKVLGVDLEVVLSPAEPCLDKVCSLMLTKGSDQLSVSAEYEERDSSGIMRNYGELLAELNEIVPDSIVCYFPNFHHLEQALLKWNETGLLYRLMAQKLVFFESEDLSETMRMLQHFKLACTSSRGAVLLALSNGFVSSSFNEEGPFKRCVVIFGVPVSDVLTLSLIHI